MNIKSRTKKQKGVALIFALFTIAVLFSISTTVVALSLHHRQDTQVMSYNDAALQAANWGIEAAINYMGQPGRKFEVRNRFYDSGSQWKAGLNASTGYESYVLEKVNPQNATAAGGQIGIRVEEIDSATLREFGLNYESGWEMDRDRWKQGDSVLIRFAPGSGRLYPPTYPVASGSPPYSVVNVVCTEIRTRNQPSTYELVSIASVVSGDDPEAKMPNIATGEQSDPRVTEIPQTRVIASRVVSANVRQLMASDFMHFVQNARSWDATGVDLWSNTVARNRVFIPEGYRENGRLRVDGYDTDENPEKNALKMELSRLGYDGSLAFLYKNNFDTKHYSFPGDVTTMRGASSFEKQQIGGSAQDIRGETGMFTGQLRDATPSLGLPDVDDYFDTVVAKKMQHGNGNDVKFEFEVGKGGESVKTVRWDQSGTNKVCPDVAQAKVWRADGNGKWEEVGSATPTFATVRVEICGDQVRVVKYNAAMTTDRMLLGTSQSQSDGQETGSLNTSNLDSRYVQQLQGWTSIDKVRNGLISVTGGNVEVVNVKNRYESSSGLCENYVDAEKTSGEGFMNGALTIVANVEAERESAVGDLQTNKNEQPGNGGIYSTKARQHWEENPYVNIPPFSAKELGTGSSTEKKYWPSPANSAIEREGNVIIGSDLRQVSGGMSGNQALGIVAKNLVYLHDKNADGSNPSTWDPEDAKGGVEGSLNNLLVDAVLMSIDHSVQMDWNNMGGNKYHDRLIGKRRGADTQDTLAGKDGDHLDNRYMRRFTLNGAIVSGFMDVEGDSTGAGYFDQKFTHDPNLLYNLPPNFPKWDLIDASSRGCFMDFMVMEYKDHGAINNLGYE